MTRGRPPDELIFRPVEERDQASLEAFTCSSGATYQDEVQDFIRRSALLRALAPATLYRLHVVLERERLVAVFGHHPELLLVDAGQDASGTATFRGTTATRLHVLALSLADHRRRLSVGHRLSDLVMETLISEALGDRANAVLTAIVARDNLVSLALCERHALMSQIEYDARHVRLSARFSRAV